MREGEIDTTERSFNSPRPHQANRTGRDAMRIIRFCVALILLCAALPAAAQEKYPNRPVKFVVSFAAGGSNDIIARVLCDWLSDHFGQQFVVETVPERAATLGPNRSSIRRPTATR